MKNLVLFTLCALLSACAKFVYIQPVSVPKDISTRWQINRPDPSLILLETDKNGALRALWTDAFGLPLARKILQNGIWQDDGLLPPNEPAEPLFNALLLLQLPEEQRERAFPEVRLAADNTRITAWLLDHPLFLYDCAAPLAACRQELHKLSLSKSVNYTIKQLP